MSDPLKILHIIHSVDPRSGGPSYAIRSLVRQQVDRGHDVSLLTTTTQSAEPWEPAAEYVRRMRADAAFAGAQLAIQPSLGRRRPWSRYAYSPGSRNWLSQQCVDRDLRPDVVHVHGTFSHITYCGAAAARRYGVPYIVRPAGSLDAICLARGSRQLKRLFLSVSLKRDLSQAAFVQAMSRVEALELNGWCPTERVRVIPHGVDVPVGQEEGRDLITSRFRELGQRPHIIFMSRIHAIKRPDLLVKAFAMVRARFPELLLVMAGSDAGALEEVRALIQTLDLERDVLFTEFLSGDLKSAMLMSAKAFVLPSAHENFGVAVVEAMAHGTPVIVTPTVASHEFVDASGCGLTVDGTAEAIAAGLHNLLKVDRDTIGRRGRDFVREHLSWPAVAEQIDEMYRDAMRSGAIQVGTARPPALSARAGGDE